MLVVLMHTNHITPFPHNTHALTAPTPSHNTHTLTAQILLILMHTTHTHTTEITHITHTLTVPTPSQCQYLVYPHCEGVPVRDEEPLPHIELGVIDQQRTLNVLLDHPPEEGEGGGRSRQTSVHDLWRTTQCMTTKGLGVSKTAGVQVHDFLHVSMQTRIVEQESLTSMKLNM